MALTTRGGATPQDGLDVARMPVADKQGRLDYERTFSAKAVPDGLIENLASLHVVQHGIDVNDNDKYDLEALGESTFAANLGVPNVPEEATNPASCGVVQSASAAEPAHDGPEMGGADGSRPERSASCFWGRSPAAVGRIRRLGGRRSPPAQ